jgi:NAD(P)-dependent dehydrogenase (short-subunit alcohol dehydrogenase family)
MSLAGKVALVTGAARGIGRVTALVLSREGAHVGVADLLPEVEGTATEIRATGGRSAAAVFDVSDPAQVGEGVARIVAELGEVDILVNNAAIVNNIAPLSRMSHEAWLREISVNLGGAFNVTKEVLGPMVRKGWGRIVNISSLGAQGGLQRQIGYASSKAGLVGFTKTVALEHARDNITCNAVLPGMIETELVSRMPEEIKEAVLSDIPAGRFGTMEEVAHLVAFLVSDRAGFINGAEIRIDGGMGLLTKSLGSRREARQRRRDTT